MHWIRDKRNNKPIFDYAEKMVALLDTDKFILFGMGSGNENFCTGKIAFQVV